MNCHLLEMPQPSHRINRLCAVVLAQTMGSFAATSMVSGLDRTVVFLAIVPLITVLLCTTAPFRAKSSFSVLAAGSVASFAGIYWLRRSVDASWFAGPVPADVELAGYGALAILTMVCAASVCAVFSSRGRLRQSRWIVVGVIAVPLIVGAIFIRHSVGEVSPSSLLQTIVRLEHQGVLNPAARQELSVLLASCGREADAESVSRQIVLDRNGYGSGAAPRPSSPAIDISKIRARPWREVLTEVAARERLILVMEAHNEPKHRQWIEQALPVLRAAGFRDYAAEGLSESGQSLRQRGYPISSTGPYVCDPHFGNVLRTAINLGFEIHAYESQGTNFSQREHDQAENLARFFTKNPDLKLVVHAGYGHVLKKSPNTGEKSMAAYLWEMTGIEPYCIWQIWHSSEEGEARHLAGLTGTEGEPTMLPTVPNGLRDPQFHWTPGAVDALVVHSASTGGPAQRVHSFPSTRQRVAGVWHGSEWPVLVGAFKKGEPADAIALDQVMLRAGETDFVLWVPGNDYEVRLFGMNGLVKAGKPNGVSALKITGAESIRGKFDEWTSGTDTMGVSASHVTASAPSLATPSPRPWSKTAAGPSGENGSIPSARCTRARSGSLFTLQTMSQLINSLSAVNVGAVNRLVAKFGNFWVDACHVDSPADAHGHTTEVATPPIAESEFASVEEARTVEARLQAAADKVAPAVVQLFSKTGDDEISQGSGVVINSAGWILTHGHHDLPKDTHLKVRFPAGEIVEAVIESTFSGKDRDFSLLRIEKEGRYPAIVCRDTLPATGDRCFHLGYPSALREILPVATPVLRLGRIAGVGAHCIYSNCLISSGDSGGPLFDLDGRLIGVLDASIGPDLCHPGKWADVIHILDGATFLTPGDGNEVVKMGFLNGKRDAVDTRRHFTNSLGNDLLTPARRATVEVLIDGQPVILGTIVDPSGYCITKRSEIMTHGGILLGSLSCRTFAGEELAANVVADAVEEDVALLQLPKGGWQAIALSSQPEPRRSAIVVVPVPGSEISETGVIGSEDRPSPIDPWQGSVPIKVEDKQQGLTVISSAHELEQDRLTPLIRGTLREGDVVTQVDGVATPNLASFERETSRSTHISGDFLQFTIRREAITAHAFVPLDSYRGITSNDFAHPSLRLSGLPAVFTHDSIVVRKHCGGPVVDLEGHVIGVNFARFHRFATLAIPSRTILDIVRKLSSSIRHDRAASLTHQSNQSALQTP